MPSGLGNAPVFYAHAAAGDPASGTGSLSSRDWQDAPSLATTLSSLGAGASLGSRLGVGMPPARDEKMSATVRGCGMRGAGDLQASGNSFSRLLAVTDSASIVSHTEPHDDVDDSGLHVGPGNPDM